MELILQECKMRYLKRVLFHSGMMEQTADVIVPDSIPDAEQIVDAFATVQVESSQCEPDSVSVSGMIHAGAIFTDREGEAHSVQSRIPFSIRKELPPDSREPMLQYCCRVCNVDARTLNSRKLLLRVGILCEMTVYAQEEWSYGQLSEPRENLQLRRRELPLKLPAAYGEKSVPLNDELELSTSDPAIAQILKAQCRLQIPEQKVVGGKGVFKGELLTHILYKDEENRLHSHDWRLPFSQYVEFDRDFDEAELRTCLALCEFEVEPDSQLQSRRLFLHGELKAQCTAYAIQNLELIEDAFCTDAELEPQWKQWESSSLLDGQGLRETATLLSDDEATSVVDAWAYIEDVEKEREGDLMHLRLPLHCNVVYYDKEGKLRGRNLRTTVSVDTALHEKATCRLHSADYSELYCSASSHGLELRVPMSLSVDSFAEESIRTVCGGEITELPPTRERKPAVILRRTDGQEELWDIAKACRTPMEAIARANDVEGTVVPANTMLLIPM